MLRFEILGHAQDKLHETDDDIPRDVDFGFTVLDPHTHPFASATARPHPLATSYRTT